jgi:hypothetical protein
MTSCSRPKSIDKIPACGYDAADFSNNYLRR